VSGHAADLRRVVASQHPERARDLGAHGSMIVRPAGATPCDRAGPPPRQPGRPVFAASGSLPQSSSCGRDDNGGSRVLQPGITGRWTAEPQAPARPGTRHVRRAIAFAMRLISRSPVRSGVATVLSIIITYGIY
jgi:hypothetical protein